jgi:hypothetical protein
MDPVQEKAAQRMPDDVTVGARIAVVICVATAVLVLFDLCAVRELAFRERNTAQVCLFLLVVLALLVNTGLGALALMRTARTFTSRTENRGLLGEALARAAGRIACTSLPFVVFFVGHSLRIPDRVFVWHHHVELEAAVAGGLAAKGAFMGVSRVGTRTVIQVCEVSVGDCYWLIHDSASVPLEGDSGALDPFLSSRRESIKHICGPWYTLVD